MKKFIIFTHGRSGSTLINFALQKHPEINMFKGEPLNSDESNPIIKNILRKLYGNDMDKFDGKFAHKYNLCNFTDILFNKYDGFKIITNQVEDKLDLIKHLQDVKCVFLQRNWLEIAISYQVALTTGVWQNHNKNNIIVDKSFNMKKDNLIKFFDKCEKTEKYLDIFKNKIIIEYKDISNNWYETFSKIQQFLEVEVRNIEPQIFKRISSKHTDLVKNYKELKNEFQYTKYYKFFNCEGIML